MERQTWWFCQDALQMSNCSAHVAAGISGMCWFDWETVPKWGMCAESFHFAECLGFLRSQAGRYILISFQNVAEGIIILLFLFEVTINLVRKSTKYRWAAYCCIYNGWAESLWEDQINHVNYWLWERDFKNYTQIWIINSQFLLLKMFPLSKVFLKITNNTISKCHYSSIKFAIVIFMTI